MIHVIGDHEKRAFIGSKIQAVIDTIVDHYNIIAHQLTAPGRYAPVLMRTDEGEVFAGDWADGFFGAISSGNGHRIAQKQTGDPIIAILLHWTKP